LPVAHYASDDHLIAKRISHFMRRHELADERYYDLVSRFASRPLAAGIGVQSYASYRRDQTGGMLMTVYLSPELFGNRTDTADVIQRSVGHLISGAFTASSALSEGR
jgi:hypothetical protein